MPTLSQVRRKPGPAIAWRPIDGFNGALAGTPGGAVARTPELYLTQAAILEVDAHLRESTSPVPFGLLVGALCISPQENLVYLLIDTVTRSRTELSESDPYAQLASELRTLAAHQEKQGKLTIGWYVGGMADDLSLDNDVRGLHRALFPEPRHVLLLRGQADGIEHGAFLRFDSSTESSYAIPFFELLPEREIRISGERRTAIRWNEYRTHTPVLPLGASEANEQRGDVTSPSPWGTRGSNPSLESFHRAGHAPSREQPSAAPASTSAAQQQGAAERMRAERAVEHQDRPSAPGEEAAAPVEANPGALASTKKETATQQRAEVTPPPSESESRGRAQSSRRNPAPLPVEHVEPLSMASAEANGAHRTSASDLQHIFIDGGLVPVRWTHRFNRKSRVLATIRGVRIAPLLMVVLVMLALATLYWFSR